MIPLLDSGEIILNENGHPAFKATQVKRRTNDWRQFQDDPRNIMYETREECVEIENPQEESQSGTAANEVKETQEAPNEEKTRTSSDEIQTQENNGSVLVESVKPKMGKVLRTCKEERNSIKFR